MRKKSNYLLIFIMLFSISTSIFQSCDLFRSGKFDNLGLGINGTLDNGDSIEDDIMFGTYSAENLPASADLSDYFPPIGDQGQYGTCVAWACGYNLRSFLDAKANEYTNYTDDNKIFSAKDLFLSIADRGEDCNGAFFESAFDVMITRGIATQATVPYTDLGDCSDASNSGTSEAANHTIESYREIDIDITTIKTYLANGRAVVFGAQLGDEFMDANSDDVLSSQTYGYTGQHAYHAMILCGYDDSKNAFRLVNSWGTSWGDGGYLWVDQDFFVTDEFCFGAYVASETETDPDNDNNGVVDDDEITAGLDLLAWQLYDVDFVDPQHPTIDDTDPRWRVAVYNVYNTSDVDVNASEDWSIIYLLYNAYDADEYQIILFDYYSDDYGSLGENDELESYDGITAQELWWNHINVPSGYSCAKALYGSDEPFNWPYQVPLVTGDYYLVIIADGFDQFVETDEDNNFSYYAYEDGSPLEIINGVIQNPPAAPTKSLMLKNGVPTKGQASDFPTVKTKSNANAYTTAEIGSMLKHHMQTGELQKKVVEFNANKGTKTQYVF